MALGAQRGHVSWMFLKTMIYQLALGLTIGLAGAAAVGQLLRGMLRRTGALDPSTFALVATVLIATALLASFVPVRRASRLDPAVTLRHE
jgi:putative ABC transport system permease protein